MAARENTSKAKGPAITFAKSEAVAVAAGSIDMVIGGYDTKELGREYEERKEWHRERTQAIDRPYGPETNERARVVPVAVVVMALHIIAARLALKEFAGKLEGMLKQMSERVEHFGTGTVIGSAGKAMKTTGTALRTGANVLVGVLDADLLEMAKEVAIRRNCWAALRDVFKLAMSQKKKRRRKTKLVSTRHHTAKQRKANKSWRQPR